MVELQIFQKDERLCNMSRLKRTKALKGQRKRGQGKDSYDLDSMICIYTSISGLPIYLKVFNFPDWGSVYCL